jgi:FixJ family two-component response regulator
LIAAGKTNREPADDLALSVRAVEDRRSRLMKKVGAKSVVDLVQMLAERPG